VHGGEVLCERGRLEVSNTLGKVVDNLADESFSESERQWHTTWPIDKANSLGDSELSSQAVDRCHLVIDLAALERIGATLVKPVLLDRTNCGDSGRHRSEVRFAAKSVAYVKDSVAIRRKVEAQVL
jgi:hypothetical protein